MKEKLNILLMIPSPIKFVISNSGKSQLSITRDISELEVIFCLNWWLCIKISSLDYLSPLINNILACWEVDFPSIII